MRGMPTTALRQRQAPYMMDRLSGVQRSVPLKRRFIQIEKGVHWQTSSSPRQLPRREYHNIEQQMAEPEVASDPDKMRKLGRRHAGWASSFPHTPHTSR